MPRIPRMVIDDETTVYHIMSRTALDGFAIGDIEKDFMLNLIRRYSALHFVEILGFCIMGNPPSGENASRIQIYRSRHKKTLCRFLWG